MRIERVLAPNPGIFTGPGTNTWILDTGGSVAIIDPGPVDRSHAEAIVEHVGDRPVVGVLVTHTHIDHAPLANPLSREFEVPAYGHGPGPEFDPDIRLADGSRLEVDGLDLEIIHTPGHSDDHLCFLAGKVLFTGDHIMGGSSVMIEKLAPYLDSLERLRPLDLEALHPGHGDVMTEPQAVIDWYIAHRLEREREIIEAIEGGATRLAEIVEVVYRDVDSALHPLAARSVVAHLDKLAGEGRLVREGERVQMSEGA